MKFTKFMRFYFWAALAVYVAATITGLTLDPSDKFFRYQLYVDVLWFIGIFGYGHSKNIFPPILWVFFLALLIGLDVIGVIELITEFEKGKLSSEDAPYFTILYGFLFILSLPAYLAIYLYGFERDAQQG